MKKAEKQQHFTIFNSTQYRLMETTVLLKYGSLELRYEAELAEDVREAIINTVLGNPGKLQYRHLDAEKKVQEIEHINFFTLRHNGYLYYVMALVERIAFLKSHPFNTYYVRYVTFNPGFQKKESGKNTSKRQAMQTGNSFIKEGIKKHADTYPFSIKSTADKNKKIYYAYVEKSNTRSMDFTEFFFEKIRTITGFTFSRLFPGKNKNVSIILEKDMNILVELLQAEYQDYSFFFFDEDDLRKNYYVLKKGDEIVAGSRAEVNHWKMVHMPGFVGKILMFVLPVIPFFSRIMKKNIFRFLTFDTIYCKEGEEDNVLILFESICNILRTYVAIIYLDIDCSLYRRIRKRKKFGFLNRMYKGADGTVVARFINFTEEEKKDYLHHPVFVSGYDFT